MKLSIVIPSYNEAESLPETILSIYKTLCNENINHEILVINDNSIDNTIDILNKLQKNIHTLHYITNESTNGFGYAVRMGLENFSGDCVAIMMADLSDSPDDLVKFYNELISKNVDCVFGSRFIKGGKVTNYPKFKLFLNRIANTVIKNIFLIKYNDCTNAFKLYKRETIEGLKPFLSHHFNLTLELPLKAIIRGYSYTVLPNSWTNRKHGESKLKIKEMGGRYFFIFMYCFIEKNILKKFNTYIIFYRHHGLFKLFRFIFKRINEYIVLPPQYRNAPRKIHVETTSFCNLTCEFCLLHKNMPYKKIMSVAEFKKLYPYIKYLKHISLSGIAEPLINKNIGEFIKIIKEENKKCNVSLITNAVLLNEKFCMDFITYQLDELTFSIESIYPEINDKLRKGASLYQILQNIQTLNRIKEENKSKYPKIYATIILQKQNFEELPDIIDALSQYNIEIIIINGLEPYAESYINHVLWLPNRPQHLRSILIKSDQIAREKGIHLHFSRFKPSLPHCQDIYTPFILPNGDVSPCAVLTYERDAFIYINERKEIKNINEKNTSMIFGNIFKENLIDIWLKKEYVRFRENVILKNFPPECKNCLIKSKIICPRENISFKKIIEDIN